MSLATMRNLCTFFFSSIVDLREEKKFAKIDISAQHREWQQQHITVIRKESIRPLRETMHSIYLNLSLMDFSVFFAFESLVNETSSVSFFFLAVATTINTLTMATAATTTQLHCNVIERFVCSHSVNQLSNDKKCRFSFFFPLQTRQYSISLRLCSALFFLKTHKSNRLYNFTALAVCCGPHSNHCSFKYRTEMKRKKTMKSYQNEANNTEKKTFH